MMTRYTSTQETSFKAYRAYREMIRQKKETLAKINKGRFKRRILKFKRSKPNPKQGGWFVSNNGKPENTGLKFNSPIDVETFLDLEIDPKDNIFFEAGQIYNVGDFDITSNNVRLSRYGTGVDPILRGSDDISGLVWTDEGGGVYSTPMAAEPNWIWINGLCAKMAETPRIPILSRGSNTTITVTHALVSGYTNIVGAYLLAKETPFKVSRLCTVTNYNGAGVITVNQDIPQGSGGAPNVDLVLLNQQDFFVGNNEWVWTAGTLYVKATASPSTLNIRAGAYDYAFKSSGSLTVDNIEFAEYYTVGVWMNGGIPNIQNCSFHDIRDDAVFIQEAVTGAVVSNNTLLRIGNNGIFMRSCSTSNFNDNTFTDIGMQDNYGWQTWISENLTNQLAQGNGMAIVQVVHANTPTTNGTGCVYERNVITNTAYNGISQHTGTNPTIQYNILTNCLNRFIDGGAIYTFHYRQTNLPIENAIIAYNIVDNQKFTSQTVGIYCDNRTRAANVHHNTVENCYWGILFNYDTEGHTCDSNNVYNCTRGICYLHYNLAGFLYTDNINNVCTNNVVGVTGSGHYAMLLQLDHTDALWTPFSGTGSCDNNTYIKNTAPEANDVYIRVDNVGDTFYTLAEFQAAWSVDASSVKLTRNPVLFINPTNAVSNEDAESDYKDFSEAAVTTYTIAAFYSRILNEINYSNFFESVNTEYLTAGTTADIQFTHTDEYTIAVRFKLPANPGVAYSFVDNRNGSSRGYVIQVNTSGFLQFQAVNTVATNRYQMIHNVDVADNAWHQFVCMKETTVTNSRFWLDGVEIFNVSGGASNLTATTLSTDALTLGRANPGATTMDGYLDDVAIWLGDKSSLITQIYNGGRSVDYRLNMPDDLPLHYWRLGQNPSLIDGYDDIGTSVTPLDLTAVNGVSASTDAT